MPFNILIFVPSTTSSSLEDVINVVIHFSDTSAGDEIHSLCVFFSLQSFIFSIDLFVMMKQLSSYRRDYHGFYGISEDMLIV